MRQIKFRAWDDKNKLMRTDFAISAIPENSNASLEEESQVFQFMATLPPKTKSQKWELMQFTGLHDKNGKEIYESDILQLDGMNIIVEWIHDEHRLGWSPYISCNGNTGFEIIGNIYESPELLPVKE